ncbi:MAG: hypothetical protein ABF379_02615 [Akkermansiaceae bacterium]
MLRLFDILLPLIPTLAAACLDHFTWTIGNDEVNIIGCNQNTSSPFGILETIEGFSAIAVGKLDSTGKWNYWSKQIW